MKVTSIRLKNFRSFPDSDEITLDSMNVLIGSNNSGKSSVLRGLHQLQVGLDNEFGDVRVGSNTAVVEIQLIDVPPNRGWGNADPGNLFTFSATINSNDRRGGSWNGTVRDYRGQQIAGGQVRIQNVEPHHFVIPYWSKRKSTHYEEDIREQYVMQVAPDVRNLAAKLSRLANPAFPRHAVYAAACEAILGFTVTSIPSPNGQRPGIYLPDQTTIPIEQMGEGVPNIVHMLASLATSSGKLFLVEEPENDLHPTALKSMLDLMIASASTNQFVVSTHSNIVVRHLCGVPNSRLFRVASPRGVLPVESQVQLVPPTPEARIAVLGELGYSFSDFDLWDGWLILEESSAERIIRDYLIPWFTPKLARIRCVAAGGVNRIEPMLDDFLRLVLFTHLQPVYSGRTWVRVDNDNAGQEVVLALSSKFSDWPDGRIRVFPLGNFEHFYPHEFSIKVNDVLAIEDKRIRRQAKKDLLQEVIAWLDADANRGKAALKISAAQVIQDLSAMEVQL